MSQKATFRTWEMVELEVELEVKVEVELEVELEGSSIAVHFNPKWREDNILLDCPYLLASSSISYDGRRVYRA